MIFFIILSSTLVAIVLSGENGGMPTSISGNVGMYGNDNGDVYAGKIKEGVYGTGGRIEGNIGLTGTAGWGRKKREVGMKASGADATSLTGAGSGNKFSMAGSSAGKSELLIGGFPGRKRRETGEKVIEVDGTLLTGSGS